MRALIVFRGLLVLLAMADLVVLVVILSQLGAFEPRIPRYGVLGVAIVVCALMLAPLVGLWFYHKWARVLFIVILILPSLGDLVLPHRSHLHFHLPFFFGEMSFWVHGFYGALVAMMFLPPVRDMFGRQSNQSLEPTAGRRDVPI
jgi:hypothetical protein